MRFLVTMNMPAASGAMVHQLTLDHPSESCEALLRSMNSEEFLLFQMHYRRKTEAGESWWEDRGETIINTHHIGKVQEFIDMEEHGSDESQGRFGIRRRSLEAARGAVRTSRLDV
jgi:hypothetical protein